MHDLAQELYNLWNMRIEGKCRESLVHTERFEIYKSMAEYKGNYC